MSKNYNVEHGFDMEESAIRKRIDQWNKAQKYGEKITKSLEENSEKFFASEKAFNKWKATAEIKDVNRARDKMINGLVQFMDGLADLKELSGTWLADPDYLNLLFMTAFSRSTFYEKTLHWAKAEAEFQSDRKTDLPGGYSGNGQEKIVREYDTQWFSLQFLYRQLEFTRFVPNYDVMAGIWALESNLNTSASKLLDHWFYISKEQVQSKLDMTDFTKGYFFRYNANMTSESQAHVLYILNNLFRYSMSKPMGTLEYPPWFRDSIITGNPDGDLPHSKNIIPHKISLVDIERLERAPIVMENIAGMKAIPDEPEDPKDFEDKKLASVIVKKGGDPDDVERKRDEAGYKSKWDGEKRLEFPEGTVWIADGVVVKIKSADGQKVQKLKLADGTKYKLEQQL